MMLNQQCLLTDAYRMLLTHLALLLQYLPMETAYAIMQCLLAPCPCLLYPARIPCYRQQLLRSSFFFEIYQLRDVCTHIFLF